MNAFQLTNELTNIGNLASTEISRLERRPLHTLSWTVWCTMPTELNAWET